MILPKPFVDGVRATAHGDSLEISQLGEPIVASLPRAPALHEHARLVALSARGTRPPRDR